MTAKSLEGLAMTKTKISLLLLLVLLVLGALSVSSASAGLPEEVAAQESAAEASEEIEEAAAEAAAARTEAAAARTDGISAKRLASYARRTGRWKILIARVRARKRELQRLPVTSKKRQVWLPRKRALLKEYRHHLTRLRAEIRAKEKLLESP
jgi:hypothetical protein